ncbi:hypothetical protein K7J14_15500 [Treponema zuelzerae]|uniref:Uncharacterized protein n=1 Tax=Teretinema zuelzerae TaxID=156 RepID=A0AAE3EJE2_9SPIR|nr:hypothetical protein [Teretinema zuelzerae]MCD1656105.1 hypothetical protein [Teretinema zuelzerae]
MKDINESLLKTNYPISRIQQLFATLISNREKNELFELSDIMTNALKHVNDTLYNQIKKNYNMEYSGDHNTYVIIYSVLVIMAVNNPKNISDQVIMYI